MLNVDNFVETIKLLLYNENEGGITMDNLLSIFDVSDFFLYYESMSNKKLQKLCYYSQAWYLALVGRPLINNEFQAWVHGPVCPDLYREYKDYGWNNIPKKKDMDSKLDQQVHDFLMDVYETYGEFTGDELEALTHTEKPWKDAREDLRPWEPSYNAISEEIMKEYYRQIYENENS